MTAYKQLLKKRQFRSLSYCPNYTRLTVLLAWTLHRSVQTI